jgi:hypothetical protein
MLFPLLGPSGTGGGDPDRHLVLWDKMAYMVIPMMNAQQYRDALDKLGLSQLRAGELFRVGARTSRRWALDEARIPHPVAILLRLLVKKRIKLKDIEALE